MPSVKEFTFAAVSLALGAWTFLWTQQVTADTFPPLLQACMDPTDEANDSILVPFEPLLGFKALDPFVCLITQFLHQLAEDSNIPQGLLVWGTTIVVAQPVVVLTALEAGRGGGWGPVRYPMLISLLHQLFGMSVVFSAIWIPSYCFGRGTTGAVSRSRAYMAVLLLFPGILLSALVFTLDVKTYAWTVSAGMLGGPALALAPALLWVVGGPPTDTTSMQQGARAATMAYAVSGVLAFLGWVCVVYVAYSHYQFNVEALWNDLWTDASAGVKFMAINALVLWLGTLCYIAFSKPTSAVEAIFLSPFFGPGSACALVLAEIEIDSMYEYGADTKPKKE